VAIFAEDTAGAHGGMEALKGVLKTKEAEIVYETYAPPATTISPHVAEVVAAKPQVCTLWWGGANSLGSRWWKRSDPRESRSARRCWI